MTRSFIGRAGGIQIHKELEHVLGRDVGSPTVCADHDGVDLVVELQHARGQARIVDRTLDGGKGRFRWVGSYCSKPLDDVVEARDGEICVRRDLILAQTVERLS